jgi:spermidine/putrescine-binding protein
VVHVYNWTDYVDPKVLERFTAETGIKVVYDTYDTNEIVETKLLAGKSGYDVVVPRVRSSSVSSGRACSRSSTAPSCRT